MAPCLVGWMRRRAARLQAFHEYPGAVGGLVAGGVDRLDLQERPPRGGELNGLGEGAVGLHRHRLVVDRHRGARLGVAADDEDRAIGLHGLDLQLGGLLVARAGPRAAGDDAEAPGGAPRAAHVAGGNRGDAPEEGALPLHAEGGAGAAAVGDVDDVVGEEAVLGHLQGVALATRHPLPREPQLFLRVDVEVAFSSGLTSLGGPGRVSTADSLSAVCRTLCKADTWRTASPVLTSM